MDKRTERLITAFTESGMTQTELCKATGITKGALSSYLSGRYLPKQQAVEKLAVALSVPVTYLMGWDEPSSSSLNTVDGNSIRIPVFGRIPAGIPLEAIEDIRGFEELSPQLARSGKEYFALQVQGESMQPKYMDGDIVIFERQSDCESGEDCAIRINGNDATFKKVRKQPFGITLQPINPEFEPIQIDYADPDLPIEILGVARELRRQV